MEQLVNTLRRDYPTLTFVAGVRASWSPSNLQITYSPDEQETNSWSLLHELGHAILEHQTYQTDIHLVQMEADAWEQALVLAANYHMDINPDHIQDCLDTYRDWLHKRSTCPSCGRHGLQQSEGLYRCLNCQDHWRVSSARFCRAYRLKMRQRA